MLNYEQFKEQFTDDLKKNLEDQGIKVEKVEVIPNEKLQEGPYDAVTVRLEDSIVGTSGNLTDVFDAYERGGGSISLFYGSVIWWESFFGSLWFLQEREWEAGTGGRVIIMGGWGCPVT